MRPFLKYLVFILVVYLSISAYAQNSCKISGNVKDKKTNKPLGMVNVFLDGTSLGYATNENGNYEIKNIPQDKYILIVSMIGYKQVKIEVDLFTHKNQNIDLSLVEQPLQGQEVMVVGEDLKEWRTNLERFKRAFGGLSEFGENCQLLNPEVFSFELVDIVIKNRPIPGIFTKEYFIASACSPLLFINQDLGYKVFLNLKKYQATIHNGELFLICNRGTLCGSTLLVCERRFISLEPDNSRNLAKWEKNRLKVYQGSLRHFLYSLAHNCTKDEGFVILDVKTQECIEPSKIFKKDEISDNYILNFSYKNLDKYTRSAKQIEVWYKNELNDIQIYINSIVNRAELSDAQIQRQVQKSMYQISKLYLTNKAGVVFNKKGIIIDRQRDLTYSGYWHWAISAAEWLPDNYSYKDE